MSETNTLRKSETQCCETSKCDTPKRQHIRRPYVRVIENDEAYLLSADLPGVDENGVEVTFEKDTLHLRGEVKSFEPEGFRKVYSERVAEVFERSFTVPNDIDRDAVEATLVNGVLTLQISKAKEAMPKKVTVKAG